MQKERTFVSTKLTAQTKNVQLHVGANESDNDLAFELEYFVGGEKLENKKSMTLTLEQVQVLLQLEQLARRG
jgi:hypothetical protein